MQSVSQRTGLSPHVIRVWEKRYKAVSPERTQTKRRYYSESEVERLQLLKKLTEEKYRIGRVAHLPIEELRKLATFAEQKPKDSSEGTGPVFAFELLAPCFSAIEKMDTRRLSFLLARTSLTMSTTAFMNTFLHPLLRELWRREREGQLRPVQAQAGWLAIRGFLSNLANVYDVPDDAPGLVVAAPVGQYHEWGPLFASTVAASTGWKVLYAGVNLAAEEIAAAVAQVGAKAAVMSGTSLKPDLVLERELKQLRNLLPSDVPILIYGEMGGGHPLGLRQIIDLNDLKSSLGELRSLVR